MSDVSSPVTGFSHVQLVVSDVAASEAWYSLVLGCRRFYGDAATGYVGLSHRASGMVLALSLEPHALDGTTSRLDHLAFGVPTRLALDEWAAHLSANGLDHDGVVAEGRNWSLQLRDPDGLAIELVAPGEM